MIDSEQLFYKRDIIIPVIGDNCFFYDSGSEKLPLQAFLVDALTEKGSGIDPDLLDQMKTRGYYGLTLVRKHCYNNDEENFECGYRRAINENQSHIHLNKTIKEFLQAYKFPVIVTTSCLKFIESELMGCNYESVWYPSNNANRGTLNNEKRIVYHIFGLADNGAEWVACEEDLLLAVHKLHSDGASDLKNYINTWFTVIAVVIAIVGALSPLLQRKDSPSIISVSQPDVNDIARRVSELLKNKGG